jgi:plasmid stability protein
MRNPTGDNLQEIGLDADLVARLRRRAHRRGMSIEQALGIYLATGLACDRRRSDRYPAAREVGGIDILEDALDGRR